MPLIITNCIDELPLPIYGSGLNVRDWLYVDDHCKAIYDVINNGKCGETYNVGANNEITNIQIVKSICVLMDKIKPRTNGDSYANLIKFIKDRPGHDFRYAIDNKKIVSSIGWKPQESFDSALLKTVKWYIENENWWRPLKNKKN
tara:strand:- start:76 stop:510 length:435 start_codon:yes stop_codon:yes gene_type:complete